VFLFAVRAEELHEGAPSGWVVRAGSRVASSEQAHQVFFDPPPDVVVGRVGQRALPHLDGFVFETGTLVEDREVLQGREVTRREIDRRLERVNALEELVSPSVEQA